MFSTLIDQATNGPGQFPAEAPSFLAGFPAAPGTPYDLLSTNVQTPGVAGHAQLRLQAIGDLRNYEGGIELGAGYVRGSAAQAGYWSEPLLPTLNPHLGAQVFPLPITFPFHAGQDDVTAFRTSIVSGYVQTHDQRVRVQGGFLNLGQSDGFVFQQPAIPNVIPGLAPQIAESIGKGAPIADQWAASATNLPLQGIDIQVHPGALSAEISDVGLPAIATTPARATIVSIVFDRKDAVRLSAEMAHITTGGAPDITPIYFGSSQSITPTAQGQIPTSTIGGQRSTVAGVRAEGRNVLGLDAVAEIGRSSYEADEIAHPGTRGRGGFYHLGASKTVGRVTAGIDGYRFEPNYATAFLPYGTPENEWNLAYAWPGQWLKSTYQSVDNSVIGVNRQGYRLRYFLDGGPLEIHAAYTNYAQIIPATADNASQTGFVDGVFLPQFGSAVTLGRLHRYGLWIAWHPAPLDITLDLIEDTLHRVAPRGHPEDAVSYDAPEAVLTVAEKLNKHTIVAAGLSRYGLRGSFAFGGATNLDLAQRTAFVGAQFGVTTYAGTLVELRRFTYSGFPTSFMPGATSYVGTILVLEQRFHL